MPHRGNQFEKGRLFVKFNITFPKSEELTESFKEELEKCFPRPDEIKGIDMNTDDIFEVGMHDSDIKQFQNSQSSYGQNHDEAYHNDDDDSRGASAQCQPM